MKRLTINFIAATLILFSSCSDFLDSENLTKKDNTSFPASPEDATQALYGAYSNIITIGAAQNPFLVGELLSDDRFGGGGQNDREPQALNVFRATSENQLKDAWSNFYKGIFRCNMLLSTLDQVTNWSGESQKNKIKGEASFLRAFYYFNMARMWGTVPLVIEPTPQNNPKATPEELFGQIMTDLKTAIECLPAVQQPASELGRATKWSAEALAARVYLFYDGYYQQNGRKEIILPEGGSINSNQIIEWLNDCIQNSGHQLADDFRNQWPYAIDIPEADYQYARDNNLNWLGETGDNKESMFVAKHSTLGGWDTPNSPTYSNQINIYQGLRDQVQVPFGKGWGWAPVNPKLYEEWPDNDLRKKGSVYNVNDESENIPDYKWGADMMWQETGYWQKKYIPVNLRRKDASGNEEICNYSCVLYGKTPNFQQDNTQDIVFIRFADVLLMHSELTKTTEGINKVRARVKLEPIGAYSDEAMQKERRFELAFENIRYYDLLRWYGKEAGTIMKNNMTGAKIWNMGQETTINQDRGNDYFNNLDQRIRETGGFLQIPNEEVSLSEGVLSQNSGWEGTSVMF